MPTITANTVGYLLMAGSLVVVVLLMVVILAGPDGILAWLNTGVELVGRAADAVRETVFGVE